MFFKEFCILNVNSIFTIIIMYVLCFVCVYVYVFVLLIETKNWVCKKLSLQVGCCQAPNTVTYMWGDTMLRLSFWSFCNSPLFSVPQGLSTSSLKCACCFWASKIIFFWSNKSLEWMWKFLNHSPKNATYSKVRIQKSK